MKKIFICLIVLILLGSIGIYWFTNQNKETKVKKVSNNIDSISLKLEQEKYYIKENLNRYLAYHKSHDFTLSKVIADVNSNLDKVKYEDVYQTNTKENQVMLVNKYYYLTENYKPDDLVVLTAKYNSGVNSSLRKEAAEAFMKMSDAATLDNIIIKNASAYRSYEYQVNLYDRYVARDGKEAADTYSARAGFSEHQTGLALDINEIDNNFENTDAFKWLQNNAYKYGFILRFPKDKEDITGYQYEPWHYRYVGPKVAKQITDENLTLEEYHAFYVQYKNNS